MERQCRTVYKSFCVVGVMLICLLLLWPSFRLIPVGAQSLVLNGTGREQELDLKIHTFFEGLIKGNSVLAFEELLRTVPFDTTQASIELRSKVDEISTQFGKIAGYEKYDTKRIGEDVMILRYVLKHEQLPVVWMFTFYRKPALTTSLTSPTNSWVIVAVDFDTDLKKLL